MCLLSQAYDAGLPPTTCVLVGSHCWTLRIEIELRGATLAVLLDNGMFLAIPCVIESFLDAAPCAKGHMLKRIKLWHIPPRSHDLNPVEQVWAHLKRKLRAMDLADAVAQRPLLGKTAYKLRVRRLVRSRSFQRLAANVAMGLKKTSKELIRKRGAAAGR